MKEIEKIHLISISISILTNALPQTVKHSYIIILTNALPQTIKHMIYELE